MTLNGPIIIPQWEVKVLQLQYNKGSMSVCVNGWRCNTWLLNCLKRRLKSLTINCICAGGYLQLRCITDQRSNCRLLKPTPCWTSQPSYCKQPLVCPTLLSMMGTSELSLPLLMWIVLFLAFLHLSCCSFKYAQTYIHASLPQRSSGAGASGFTAFTVTHTLVDTTL